MKLPGISFSVLLGIALWLGFGLAGFCQNGPFSPAADSVGSDAIHKDSVIVVGWASGATVQRGFEDISQGGPLASAGDSSLATGPADGGVVSLGDSGVAVVTFGQPISDHPGVDFAVFENGFYDQGNGGYFLELAFVEVSSNGIDFYRFPNTSLSDTLLQTGTFGTTDPTQIDGLAGKYKATFGTPFDLAVLDTVTALDLQNITHVRIVDVTGSLLENYAQRDSHDRKINDPWPTDFASSGFDLDAVALIDEKVLSVSEKGIASGISVYPNPASNILIVNQLMLNTYNKFSIFDIMGRSILTGVLNTDQEQIDISDFEDGIYFLRFDNGYTVKLIKQ